MASSPISLLLCTCVLLSVVAFGIIGATEPSWDTRSRLSHGSSDDPSRGVLKRPPSRIPEPPHASMWSPQKTTPPPVCPWPNVAAALNVTAGRLSVRLYDKVFPGHNATDDGPAINWAINASHLCGGVVFFDAGKYTVATPIDVPSGTSLIGGGGRGSDQFQTSPEGASIWGPKEGPVFQAHGAEKIRFENLVIIGHMTGVFVNGGALIRIVNCGIHAQVMGSGPDAVNTSATGCSGCNVVLNSNNTALVIQNTYWVWVEDSSFFFYPLYGSGEQFPHEYWGQRPSVILRGTDVNMGGGGVNSVYLVYFARTVFTGGGVQYLFHSIIRLTMLVDSVLKSCAAVSVTADPGSCCLGVRYQQLAPSNQWPGYFEFHCTQAAVIFVLSGLRVHLLLTTRGCCRFADGKLSDTFVRYTSSSRSKRDHRGAGSHDHWLPSRRHCRPELPQ
jgi:hypothetical protein